MFIFTKGYICCSCERRFSEDQVSAVYKKSCICKECFGKLPHIKKHSFMAGTKETSMLMAPFEYSGLYRDIFLKFKFMGDYALGHIIGMAAAQYFEDMDLKDRYDYIVPVPLSKERMIERGYNQTEIITKYIADTIGIPIKKFLVRKKHCIAQSKLWGIERVKNVIGAFAVNADLSGRRIILTDDIFTTGSTVNECARMLKAAGAKEVCVICAAKTKNGIKQYRNYIMR
ncbi:MAG: ComF family protein [Candidatus Ornithomonoglobus sp.]